MKKKKKHIMIHSVSKTTSKLFEFSQLYTNLYCNKNTFVIMQSMANLTFYCFVVVVVVVINVEFQQQYILASY